MRAIMGAAYRLALGRAHYCALHGECMLFAGPRVQACRAARAERAARVLRYLVARHLRSHPELRALYQ